MKGISSKVTKALPTQAKLDCADNTGAKIVQLINVLKKGGVAGRYPAHLPSCIGDVNPGDFVRIMECRPLSKTVKFCVIEKGD